MIERQAVVEHAEFRMVRWQHQQLNLFGVQTLSAFQRSEQLLIVEGSAARSHDYAREAGCTSSQGR